MNLRLLWLFLLTTGVAPAADAAAPRSTGTLADTPTSTRLASVIAADDARVAAFKKPSTNGLSAVLSEDLRYAHSTGAVDTKSSIIEALSSGKIQYLGFDYEQREFTFPAPHVALMTGRVRIRATAAGTEMDNLLSFLAVWRLEENQWRFLAWQSCRLPPAGPF